MRTEEDAFFFYGGVSDIERVGVLLQIEEIKCAFGGEHLPFNWDGREMGPNLPLLQGRKHKEKNQLATDKTKIPGPASSRHGNAMHWLCTEVFSFLCSNISRFSLALTRKGGGGGDSFSILFLQVLRLQQGIMGTSVTAC